MELSRRMLRHATLLAGRPVHKNPLKFWKRGKTYGEVATMKTILHDFNIQHGAKMVPFCGWQMPLHYKSSIMESHIHTRKHASLFDVSHMMQTYIFGRDRSQFVESLTVADVEGLKENNAVLSMFTNDNGGIMDDCIITKTSDDHIYIVSNAGCADKIGIYIETEAEQFKFKGGDISVEQICNGLLALQGPEMVQVLQPLIESDLNLDELPFMTSSMATIAGVPDCRISRCGYTGEDGVEISVPCEKTEHVADAIWSSKNGEVRMAGLGPRDSLRLEAGLCLYGNDIDETTTPVEASLAWCIGKVRREKTPTFPGAEVILSQLKKKPPKRRVGIKSRGAPARAGTPILDHRRGVQIGEVTSGIPSPSLNYNIAMGYINTQGKIGSKVILHVRQKHVEGEIVKMPFVPHKYYYKKEETQTNPK
ncbi:aminomethyltransferase, mitochondrial [Lingula anatina]|uniref:Aminomethyltransferase n=1 Tax=Lingula anatina TaxID=7574 RepID=A0A1S3IRR9_LINAN|nr:aminomethyltransferase, mitochondrial [Lingula anatina]|eukprot:XP_013400626.1 aminomethyltransferase, mitochondrial [Lingula anatina]